MNTRPYTIAGRFGLYTEAEIEAAQLARCKAVPVSDDEEEEEEEESNG